METLQLFTIGHSVHAIEEFINLLKMHDIQLVVDVRSVPASRFHPQFRKHSLAKALAKAGIDYQFLGQALGGRPDDPTCYPGGVLPAKGTKPWPQPDYEQMMQKGWFTRGMAQLLSQAVERPTAIMCGEENPFDCHRHHLIADYLWRRYPEVEVMHIRRDGTLLPAAETLSSEQLSLW